MPADTLQSYAEALAQYHLHPESKFLGGDYLDRGTTMRRHIRVSGICHIGKEANEWERQAMLGLEDDARPEYGLIEGNLADLKCKLSELGHMLSNAGAAKALGLTPRRMNSILSGKTCLNESTALTLSRRLPAAMAQAEKLWVQRDAALQSLREIVQELGLRRAARQLGIDPSNLRRKLLSQS